MLDNANVRILITGARGQDGSLLFEQATSHGFDALGVIKQNRDSESSDLSSNSKILPWDLSNFDEAIELLDFFKPDLILHMAAVHASSEFMGSLNKLAFLEMTSCHFQITKNLLEWQLNNRNARSLIALSSQMFTANQQIEDINEESEVNPTTFYGKTKAQAYDLVKKMRLNNNVQTGGVILFNHASTRSKSDFIFPILARKIVDFLTGESQEISIRNPRARIDMTAAEEVCEGILRLAQSDLITDIVFSSGKSYELEEIIKRSIRMFDISARPQIVATNGFSKPDNIVIGNPDKALKMLDWKARQLPWEILSQMVTYEMQQRLL